MKGNIKEVLITFSGSSTISAALRNAVYRPKKTSGCFQRNYRYDAEKAKNRRVTLFIIMDAHDKDSIKFRFTEYQDWNDPNHDFNEQAKNLGEFKISLPEVLGSKDWKFYIESKERGIINVKSPEEHKEAWKADNNFHKYLASKLKSSLMKNNLIHFWDSDDDSAEHLLIGTYLEYRELALNTNLLMRKLGLN